MKTNQIICGDALKELKKLPDESIDMCITSPPYFNQRDYGVKGQLGLEETPEEYVIKLCNIFDEVKRVLRDDGCCWVNISDCYGGFQGKNHGYPDRKHEKANIPQIKRSPKTAKSLLCVPEMFLLEMVKRGWLIRNKIIWFKNNVMPSSAKDRFTIDYEMLYFFVKQKKYYFEQQFEPLKTLEKRPFGAIRQREFNYKSKYEGIHFEKKHRQGMSKDRGNNLIEKRNNLPEKKEITDFLREWTNGFEKELDKEFGEYKWKHWIRKDDFSSYPSKEDWITLKTMLDFPDTYNEQMLDVELKTDSIVPYSIQPRNKEFVEYRNLPNLKEFSNYLNEHRKILGLPMEKVEEIMNSQAPHHWFGAESYPSREDYFLLKEILKLGETYDEQMTKVFKKSSEKKYACMPPIGRKKHTDGNKNPTYSGNKPEWSEYGRNKRTIWNINTKPSKVKHFAIYPEKLCETPIKSCCPEFVCVKCGNPKILDLDYSDKYSAQWGERKSNAQKFRDKRDMPQKIIKNVNVKSFGYKPTCSCNSGFNGGIVLDPFFGSGTTGLVALKQNKSFVGIELNKDYIEIANKRLKPFLEQRKLI